MVHVVEPVLDPACPGVRRSVDPNEHQLLDRRPGCPRLALEVLELRDPLGLVAQAHHELA